MTKAKRSMRSIEVRRYVKVEPCPHCGQPPGFEPDGMGGWNVICNECYDGASDSGTNQLGWGFKVEEALLDWNASVEMCEIRREATEGAER